MFILKGAYIRDLEKYLDQTMARIDSLQASFEAQTFGSLSELIEDTEHVHDVLVNIKSDLEIYHALSLWGQIKKNIIYNSVKREMET